MHMSIKKFMISGVVMFFTFFMTLPFHHEVFAVPSNPFPQPYMQANGNEITIVGRGDEFFSWVEDGNGYVIAYDDNSGNWCYAYVSGDNRVLPGQEVAGGAAIMGLMGGAPSRITAFDLLPVIEGTDFSANDFEIPSIAPRVGISPYGLKNMNPSILVILIEFNDAAIVKGMDFWRDQFFGNEQGQLNHYFDEASGGKFQFKGLPLNNGANAVISAGLPPGVSGIEFFDGVAKVRLNKNHPTFDAGNNVLAVDIREAFDAIKGYIDFTPFGGANLHSGYIKSDDLTVYTVIAGWERANPVNNDPRRVHAHARSSRLAGDKNILSIDYNTLYLQSFATQGEIHSGNMDANANISGVGVTAHELGHSLGLPDLFDTTGISNGIGPYSIMGSGSWGYASGQTIASQTPTHFDAWSKVELGFATPIEISANEYWIGNVHSIEGNNGRDYNILKLTSEEDPLQYFLVENRGITGYDAGFFYFGIQESNGNNGGIMIYHIDESRRGANGILTNANWERRAVDVEEADGSRILRGRVQSANQYQFYNHFFSGTHYEKRTDTWAQNPFGSFGGRSGTFNAFNDFTAPNTNFYCNTSNTQTIASGIELTVNSARGAAMEVEVGVYNAIHVLGGAVTIDGGAVFGETLTAVTTGLVPVPDMGFAGFGALSYQWERDGTDIPGAVSETHTLTQADIHHVITVTVSAENCLGSVTSGPTAPVEKAPQNAPVMLTGMISDDGHTYTYTAIITPAAPNAQFKMDGGEWQGYGTFSGIAPGITAAHTFYARYGETPTHKPSGESATGLIHFPRLNRPQPTIAFTLSGDWEHDGVTITVASPAIGAEYSLDGINYSTANPIHIAPGISAVTLYARLYETAAYNATSSAFRHIDFTVPIYPVSMVMVINGDEGTAYPLQYLSLIPSLREYAARMFVLGRALYFYDAGAQSWYEISRGATVDMMRVEELPGFHYEIFIPG
jgi:M6 family metalloprotease-like protein